MNFYRLIICIIVGSLFVFGLELLVHAKLLMGIYEQTSNLWRPHEEMKQCYMFASQFSYATVSAVLYAYLQERMPTLGMMTVATLIGLLFVSVNLATYSYMPIPLILTLSWCAAVFVKAIGVFVICKIFYKPISI